MEWHVCEMSGGSKCGHMGTLTLGFVDPVLNFNITSYGILVKMPNIEAGVIGKTHTLILCCKNCLDEFYIMW